MSPLPPLSFAAMPCSAHAIDDFLSEPCPAVTAVVGSLRGTILVLGAGGKMGLHLTVMLHRAARLTGVDLRVVAVSRFQTLRERDCFTRAGVETVACDLCNPEQLRQLPEAQTVFFLAGVKFGTDASSFLLDQFNVLMPQLVAQRFRGSRIVAFSTGCVYPFVPTSSNGATEDTPVAPVGAYATSCLRREEAFADVAREAQTPVVLLRLNYSIEFRYGVLVDIATRVYTQRPVDVTMGHVNVIWQRDAVAHVIQSLTVAASPATVLNLTGPAVLSVRELALNFGEIFGVEPTFTGTEAPTAWLNDARRAHQLFGPPPTSVETMSGWIAAWLQQGGSTWGKPTGFEKRDGKF
jgi:nucleoside-diphosphate-sugar epimerase